MNCSRKSTTEISNKTMDKCKWNNFRYSYFCQISLSLLSYWWSIFFACSIHLSESLILQVQFNEEIKNAICCDNISSTIHRTKEYMDTESTTSHAVAYGFICCLILSLFPGTAVSVLLFLALIALLLRGLNDFFSYVKDIFVMQVSSLPSLREIIGIQYAPLGVFVATGLFVFAFFLSCLALKSLLPKERYSQFFFKLRSIPFFFLSTTLVVWLILLQGYWLQDGDRDGDKDLSDLFKMVDLDGDVKISFIEVLRASFVPTLVAALLLSAYCHFKYDLAAMLLNVESIESLIKEIKQLKEEIGEHEKKKLALLEDNAALEGQKETRTKQIEEEMKDYEEKLSNLRKERADIQEQEKEQTEKKRALRAASAALEKQQKEMNAKTNEVSYEALISKKNAEINSLKMHLKSREEELTARRDAVQKFERERESARQHGSTFTNKFFPSEPAVRVTSHPLTAMGFSLR